MIVGGILAAAMPVIHMRGNFAKSSGAFLYIWMLFALGTTGSLSVILAARELRRLRRTGAEDREPDGKMTAIADAHPDRRR
jgi:hypothetical protein